MATEGSHIPLVSQGDMAFPRRWYEEIKPVALKLHKERCFSGSESVLCQLLY